MRIHSQNILPFLQALVESLNGDLAGEKWHFLHIQQSEQSCFAWHAAVLSSIKKTHDDLDCDIVHCSDNDVLLISRNLNDLQMLELGSTIVDANIGNDCQGKIIWYDALRDWRIIRDLLLAKAESASAPPASELVFAKHVYMYV